MRGVTCFLVLLALAPLAAGGPVRGIHTPETLDLEGTLTWVIPSQGDAPSNHGGSTDWMPAVECLGTFELHSIGPFRRDHEVTVDVPDRTVTVAGSHFWRTWLDIVPDRGDPACVPTRLRFDASNHGEEGYDEAFDCGEHGCTTLRLVWTWTEEASTWTGDLSLAIPVAADAAIEHAGLAWHRPPVTSTLRAPGV